MSAVVPTGVLCHKSALPCKKILSLQTCCTGLECGIRRPIETRPQALLEAKDLRRTPLSDRMEEHLHHTIQQDRILRAKEQGRPIEEVPQSDSLGNHCRSITVL